MSGRCQQPLTYTDLRAQDAVIGIEGRLLRARRPGQQQRARRRADQPDPRRPRGCPPRPRLRLGRGAAAVGLRLPAAYFPGAQRESRQRGAFCSSEHRESVRSVEESVSSAPGVPISAGAAVVTLAPRASSAKKSGATFAPHARASLRRTHHGGWCGDLARAPRELGQLDASGGHTVHSACQSTACKKRK